MEKAHNFGINGLPIGYRFRPTDLELVLHYLERKELSLPLPASVIPEFDVFQTHPFALPGDVKEKRYFFYKKKKVDSSNIIDALGHKRYCSSGSGYWKPVGKGRLIVASHHSNQPVGLRRTMAFREGKRTGDTNTRWLLHEYHLVRSGPTPNSVHLICPTETNKYWVVCGVFQKKRRLNKKSETNQTVMNNNFFVTNNNRPCVVDFAVEPTMSCSSEITDDDDQEQNNVINGGCY